MDENIILKKEIDSLETLLQNVTMSKLEIDDLKVLRDKNLIKLFKLG